MIPLGRIVGEPIETYHRTNAVSKSKIDCFRESPLLYEKRFVLKTVPAPEPTEAMLFGSAAGALILEGPLVFTSRYYIIPPGVGRQRKEHKELRLSLESENPGKEPVDDVDFEIMRTMWNSLRANPEFAMLTSAGQPEVTFRMQGEHFAVQVRPDWINEEGCALTDGYPYLLDLKTIDKLPCDDPDHLPWRISSFGYHRQDYLYSEVVANVLKFPADVPRPRFFFAFVEKREPFDSLIVELGEIDRQVGERECTDSLKKLRRCYETGIWQSPRKGVSKISLPFRYVKQSLDLTDPNLAEAV